MNRGSAWRAAGLSAALALLLLAGSPEAARAGCALALGRLLVGHAFFPRGKGPSLQASVGALGAGLALAAPQLVPTLLALPEAGRQITGLASSEKTVLPGVTGLILRYVSHTPAAPLALAALPLATTQLPVRVLGAALGLCLALQWGRGPLAAPGALALVFDLALAILAGLALSTHRQVRLEPFGARLRRYFLFACLASAAALSVSAAAIGPLPEELAGAVGVLALSLILYFSLATASPVVASVWLLPLTVSFVLQPHGRQVWTDAPKRTELHPGTPTREAIDRAMGLRRGERILTLTRVWPRDPMDLAYAGLGAFAGRRSANGYDPMVALRNRAALEGMGPAGMLLGAFFRTDPARIEGLGIRWVQVHAAALRTAGNRWGLGDTLDLELNVGEPRLFPLPITPATEVRVGSSLSEAVGFPDGEPVARVSVRLASGRDLPLLLRAGRDTAEWAYDRPDVRPVVTHRRAPIYESFPVPGEGFEGHRYLARLALPGRYYVSGIRIERLPGGGRLTLRRLGVVDTASGQGTPLSLAAAFVSDPGRFREAAATPFVRLYEVPQTLGHARVVERLLLLDEDADVLDVLATPSRSGVDLRREAVAVAAEVGGWKLPPRSRASRAEVVRASRNHLDLRAAGPGLVVVAESWDPGWSASVDGRPARIARVNHVQMGIVVPEGTHRITLRYRARGFGAGLLMAATAALGLAVAVAAQRGV